MALRDAALGEDGNGTGWHTASAKTAAAAAAALILPIHETTGGALGTCSGVILGPRPM
jgi:hypothetical protein